MTSQLQYRLKYSKYVMQSISLSLVHIDKQRERLVSDLIQRADCELNINSKNLYNILHIISKCPDIKVIIHWHCPCLISATTMYISVDSSPRPAVYNGLLSIIHIISCYMKIDAYRQVSNIRRTLVGNEIVDHSDVVGSSPVGAATTTSSFST